MLRVRHCVECPKCRTRYLPGFSPYRNGSYLMPLRDGLSAEWILYCSCSNPHAWSRWGWEELKPYEVCSQAHRRRYGSPDEIWDISLRRRDTKYGCGVNPVAGRDRNDNGERGK
jgi:hypothetical protein